MPKSMLKTAKHTYLMPYMEHLLHSQVLSLDFGPRSFWGGGYPSPRFFRRSLVPGPFQRGGIPVRPVAREGARGRGALLAPIFIGRSRNPLLNLSDLPDLREMRIVKN